MDDYILRSFLIIIIIIGEYLQNERYRHNPDLMFNKDEKNTVHLIVITQMELPIICKNKLIVEDIFRFRSYASKYI